MSFRSLIQAGLINTQDFFRNQLKQEIAKLKNVPIERIERLECWKDQLWIVITGVRAQFVSYRLLPSWINQAIKVIKNTANLEELETVGKIIGEEAKNHHYEAEALEKLRQAYAEQREYLKELQPQIEHQKAGKRWLESWQSTLEYCEDIHDLEYLVVLIRIQSRKFTDLPEIIDQLNQILSNLWQKLQSSNADWAEA